MDRRRFNEMDSVFFFFPHLLELVQIANLHVGLSPLLTFIALEQGKKIMTYL